MTEKPDLAKLTADLVSSYVGNRSLSEHELERAIENLPALIGRVHEALLKIVIEPSTAIFSEATPPNGSVVHQEINPVVGASLTNQLQETVFPDYLVCMEDGQSFKTLKRHLATHHGLTPDEYRRKWGLPEDYPMSAPMYAAERAKIAKRIGLGARGRGGSPAHVHVQKKTGTKLVSIKSKTPS